MIILGIETSCDETAASVINAEKNNIKVLSNVVSSQIEIHKKYGGVVPEVAAREHVLNILPVINEALAKAKIKKELALKKINTIAVVVGPGLITSLIIGIETAKTLAYAWKIPIIGINHIEGHIYANFINENPKQNKKIKFPAIILTVSGGHTMLVLMEDHGKFKIIGETRDDAAGEAFDKAAQLLDIGYPGGPAIAMYASKWKPNIQKYKPVILPRPMMNTKDFDFSFSGLKTALLYQIKSDLNWKKRKAEYAFEFQKAIVDVLVHKLIKAAKNLNAKTIMLSGGVSANQLLRAELKKTHKEKLPNINLKICDLKYTTDNAVMIATAGYYQAQQKKFSNWDNLKADANMAWK